MLTMFRFYLGEVNVRVLQIVIRHYFLACCVLAVSYLVLEGAGRFRFGDEYTTGRQQISFLVDSLL